VLDVDGVLASMQRNATGDEIERASEEEESKLKAFLYTLSFLLSLILFLM